MNDILKSISSDPDGLLTYEFMANNIETIEDQMPALVENMIRVDAHGQFSVSAARYLHAIDAGKYSAEIDRLISAAIDKDRERVYIGSLLTEIWGPDYMDKASELAATDNNFRRIYKRLYPAGII